MALNNPGASGGRYRRDRRMRRDDLAGGREPAPTLGAAARRPARSREKSAADRAAVAQAGYLKPRADAIFAAMHF